MAAYVNDDPIFLNLYRELYYRCPHLQGPDAPPSLRHIYARVQGGPTIEQRFESYYNYCKLFNYILSADTPVNLELPNQWLWEIIDEFIYQFQVCPGHFATPSSPPPPQAFSQFRSKLAKKTAEEIETLKRNPKVWNVHSVLNVLHSLVDKSNINKQLEVYNNQVKIVTITLLSNLLVHIFYCHPLALVCLLKKTVDIFLCSQSNPVVIPRVTLTRWPVTSAVTRSTRCWVTSLSSDSSGFTACWGTSTSPSRCRRGLQPSLFCFYSLQS